MAIQVSDTMQCHMLGGSSTLEEHVHDRLDVVGQPEQHPPESVDRVEEHQVYQEAKESAVQQQEWCS